jgi:hypothetical protein
VARRLAYAPDATSPGRSHFNDDTWELYHVDVACAELPDLAAEHPTVLEGRDLHDQQLVRIRHAEEVELH